MAVSSNVGNRILVEIERISKKTTESYREDLDKNIHVLDINYEALVYSDKDLTLEEYNKLIGLLRQNYVVQGKLKQAIAIMKDKSTARGVAYLVLDPQYGNFIVGRTYDSLQRKLSPILKSLEHTSILTSVNAEGVIQANIGHIPGTSELSAANSPLKLKLLNILKNIPLGSIGALNPIIREINNLENIHSLETSYIFHRQDISKKTLSNLLTGTILVTLQSFSENNRLAMLERAISLRVNNLVKSPEFIEAILKEKSSNNIIEDLQELIIQSINPKTKITRKVSNTKTNKLKKTESLKQGVKEYRMPQLRNRQGQFSSLTSLQNLINSKLAEQIKRNMGTGFSKSILNYRTGRFASSAQVQRLTMSQQGMITAFYTYMKYPYQTFEPGYKQGSPRSRDPKLLIGKSIREIAAMSMSNRLRAIRV